MLFQYNGLARPSSQMRLLRIQHYTEGAEIEYECELQHYELADPPKYVAISYTWGSELQPQAISINGSVFSVGQNAYYALRQVDRHPQAERHIWMDSICIDQSNDEEKSNQVSIMADIFQNARVVFACVGSHDHDSDLVIDVLTEIFRYADAGKPRAGENPIPYLEKILRDRFEQRALSLSNMAERYLRFVEAFAAFGNRRFWYRRWIVQELWQAGTAYILCGQSTLKLEEGRLMDFLRSWLPNDTDALWSPTQFALESSSLVQFLRLAEDRRGAGPMPIIALAKSLTNWECTNFRDYVYSLQRIAEWPGQPPQPNYQLDKTEFLTQFLDHIEFQRGNRRDIDEVMKEMLKRVQIGWRDLPEQGRHSRHVSLDQEETITRSTDFTSPTGKRFHHRSFNSAYKIGKQEGKLIDDSIPDRMRNSSELKIFQDYADKCTSSSSHFAGRPVFNARYNTAAIVFGDVQDGDYVVDCPVSSWLGLVLRRNAQLSPEHLHIIGYALVRPRRGGNSSDLQIDLYVNSSELLRWYLFGEGLHKLTEPDKLADDLLALQNTPLTSSCYGIITQTNITPIIT